MVGGDACALFVHDAEGEAGVAVAGVGGAFEPDASLVEVFGDACGWEAVEEELAHGDLGWGVTGGGGGFDGGDGVFGVFAEAEAEEAEVVFGCGAAFGGGLLVGFFGFFRGGFDADAGLVEVGDGEEGVGAACVGGGFEGGEEWFGVLGGFDGEEFGEGFLNGCFGGDVLGEDEAGVGTRGR